MKHVLVTGASGFVGAALCDHLDRSGWGVRAAIRSHERPGALAEHIDRVAVGDLGPDTNWSSVLPGADTVVHLSARVHVVQEGSADPEGDYRKVNVEGTRGLVCAAIEAGVRRFVFVSTVGVHGKRASAEAIRESDPIDPRDAYSLSKALAERAIAELSAHSPMEWVVLRPPLVYGPAAPANFGQLLRWVHRAWPLPLASAQNLRSFVYVENLVHAIRTCVAHDRAPGEVFLVSDGKGFSTPELIGALAHAMGRPTRLFPFPESVARAAARALGMESTVERLFGSLPIDIGKIQRELRWVPPISAEEAIAHTARQYAALLAN